MKHFGFQAAIALAWVSFWVGMAVAEFDQVPENSGEPFGWSALAAVFIFCVAPAIFGFLSGAEYEKNRITELRRLRKET